MRKLNFIKKISITLLITIICSCEKTEPPAPFLEESILYLNLMTQTKTKVVENSHTENKEIDNKINCLDIFVFHNNPEGENHHTLDAYKRIEANKTKEVELLDEIKIQTTTGEKIIIAIANSHKEKWINITTLSEFSAQQALLSNEQVGEFTMSGILNASLNSISNLSISLSRLVGRIQVNSIKTNFAGTPYQGHSLSDIKIYLTNAHGNKQYLGKSVENTIILNKGKLIDQDTKSCVTPGIIYDKIPTSINDDGYHTKHYFYTYENTIEQENNLEKYTQLIIEAKLNKVLYYYPISINQEGFGYTPANQHKGIKQNTSYSIDITIQRAGTLDPNKPVEHGTLNTKVNISNWELIPHTNIEF